MKKEIDRKSHPFTHRHIQKNTNTQMYTLRYTNTAHYCIGDKKKKEIILMNDNNQLD